MLAHHVRSRKTRNGKSQPLRRQAAVCGGRLVRMSSVLNQINLDQVQRRTFTPFTITVRQTLTGFLTTTAPRGPAQPARTTPSAQTAALATVDWTVRVVPKASRAAAMSRNERMLFSRIYLGWCSLSSGRFCGCMSGVFTPVSRRCSGRR
jgi:hypothetical protein